MPHAEQLGEQLDEISAAAVALAVWVCGARCRQLLRVPKVQLSPQRALHGLPASLLKLAAACCQVRRRRFHPARWCRQARCLRAGHTLSPAATPLLHRRARGVRSSTPHIWPAGDQVAWLAALIDGGVSLAQYCSAALLDERRKSPGSWSWRWPRAYAASCQLGSPSWAWDPRSGGCGLRGRGMDRLLNDVAAHGARHTVVGLPDEDGATTQAQLVARFRARTGLALPASRVDACVPDAGTDRWCSAYGRSARACQQ
jgi:hypothetical protein